MKKGLVFILVGFFVFSFSFSVFSQEVTSQLGKVVSLKGGYKFNNIEINFENCSQIFSYASKNSKSKTPIKSEDVFSEQLIFEVSNSSGAKVYFSGNVVKQELYYSDLGGYTIAPNIMGTPLNQKNFTKSESSILKAIVFFPDQTKQFNEESLASMHGDFKDPVVRYREVEREDGSIEKESYTAWTSSRDSEYLQLTGFFYELKDSTYFRTLCNVLRIPYVVGTSSHTVLVPVGGRTAHSIRWVLDYVYGIKASNGLEEFLLKYGKE